MDNPATPTPEPDLESARQIAHDRLASLDRDLTDDERLYVENVGDVRDEFTDLECTDGPAAEHDGDMVDPDA